jgi:hypothetical protein
MTARAFKKSIVVGKVAAALACALATDAAADGLESYAPKLGLRTSNGILVNSGTSGGSALSLMGVDLLLSYFVAQSFSLGLGYQTNFDFDTGIVPLNGFNFSGRWYIKGSGTSVRREGRDIASETRDRLAIYAGGEAAQRNFFIGTSQDNSSVTVNGSFLSVNGLVGVDYALSRHFEINLEGSLGLASFAGSDDRIRIKGYLLLTGFSFVW